MSVNPFDGKKPSMKGPSIYRICVRGRLESDWTARVEGMNITESRQADGELITILVGRLADQGVLSGVLNTLYELHLPVISVDCMDSNG